MPKFALPQISISPPPYDEPLAEPFSPFSSLSLSPASASENTFRPVHLTPPPDLTRFQRQSSPLRPREESAPPVKGLERERFEELLRGSRERNAASTAQKATDLRKEITLKAHRTKHDERRALFLSKVLAPPSPAATLTPVTPPDSPAIFHFSLPSPGLASPLSLFESLSADTDGPGLAREPWIEEVDFRVQLASSKKSTDLPARVQPLPSLDQISARLNSKGSVRPLLSSVQTPSTRLPAFLTPIYSKNKLRLDVSDHMDTAPAPPKQVRKLPDVPVSHALLKASLQPLDLDSRERRAHDMMSTIRRRTLISTVEDDSRKAKWKRQSAPADLMPRERTGFKHPVLHLPGGF